MFLLRNAWLYRIVFLVLLTLCLSGGAPNLSPHDSPASALSPAEANVVAASVVPQEIPKPETEPLPGLSKKQKRNYMKANFQKMRQDADELATLAKSLQDELNKSNENILSLQIVENADKIEKLAKKIKNMAKGY
jgi:hypothetical protein